MSAQEQKNNPKSEEKTTKSAEELAMDKLRASIRKDIESEQKAELKDPRMKSWITLGNSIIKSIDKSNEDPTKSIMKKPIGDLLPATRASVNKEIKDMLDGKETATKDHKSSDAKTVLTNAFAAYLILSEKESKEKDSKPTPKA